MSNNQVSSNGKKHDIYLKKHLKNISRAEDILFSKWI